MLLRKREERENVVIVVILPAKKMQSPVKRIFPRT